MGPQMGNRPPYRKGGFAQVTQSQNGSAVCCGLSSDLHGLTARTVSTPTLRCKHTHTHIHTQRYTLKRTCTDTHTYPPKTCPNLETHSELYTLTRSCTRHTHTCLCFHRHSHRDTLTPKDTGVYDTDKSHKCVGRSGSEHHTDTHTPTGTALNHPESRCSSIAP